MFFLISATLVIIFDQLSKWLIRGWLEPWQSVPASGFFRLTHVQNTGAAFGLFPGQVGPLIVFASIGAVAIVIFVLMLSGRFNQLDSRLNRLALGLVLGGTIGNLIDRLRLGYVTDFVDIGIWPAFNVADSAIVVGTLVFAYSIIALAQPGKA